MAATASPLADRAPRATARFKYHTTKESGLPKTLVTLRLEDDLLARIAVVANKEEISMSTAIRVILRRGLKLSDYPRVRKTAKSS